MFGGKTVLELGAGIGISCYPPFDFVANLLTFTKKGITSILVAPLCRKVVMTDYLDAVFELQKVNLARNKEYLKDGKTEILSLFMFNVTFSLANIFPVKLKWNEQLDEFAQRSEETAWDIIIASDVM